ncbi:hypothetical protein V1L52_10450 [Treponema sp. HNW]|uniref:hypothetical protein n=1 Tax=Treponema sp. HNW TaxID=3116654 RepID=UPI003D098986
MKINHNFAAVCIVLGVVLLVGSGLFDHIIGGNAVKGYHKEEVYMVYDKKAELHNQVSKYVWYINYAYTVVAIVFTGAGSFFIAHLALKYL